MQRPGGCIRGKLGQARSAAAGYCRCSLSVEQQSASEPEGMGELRQVVGAGWFSDPQTTRTVDEGRHDATAITAREDPLMSPCGWLSDNNRHADGVLGTIENQVRFHANGPGTAAVPTFLLGL